MPENAPKSKAGGRAFWRLFIVSKKTLFCRICLFRAGKRRIIWNNNFEEAADDGSNVVLHKTPYGAVKTGRRCMFFGVIDGFRRSSFTNSTHIGML